MFSFLEVWGIRCSKLFLTLRIIFIPRTSWRYQNAAHALGLPPNLCHTWVSSKYLGNLLIHAYPSLSECHIHSGWAWYPVQCWDDQGTFRPHYDVEQVSWLFWRIAVPLNWKQNICSLLWGWRKLIHLPHWQLHKLYWFISVKDLHVEE